MIRMFPAGSLLCLSDAEHLQVFVHHQNMEGPPARGEEAAPLRGDHTELKHHSETWWWQNHPEGFPPSAGWYRVHEETGGAESWEEEETL